MTKTTISKLRTAHLKQVEVMRLMEDETNEIILLSLATIYSQLSGEVLELTGMSEDKILQKTFGRVSHEE